MAKGLYDYSRAVQATGERWPDLSGKEKRPDWATRVALAGNFADLLPNSVFGSSQSAVSDLTPLSFGQAHCEGAGKPKVNASTTYKIRKALQRHACPQLVDFSLALADEEYAEIYRLRQLANGEPSRSGPGTTIVNASSPNSWEKIADLEESMMDKLMHAPGNNLMLFTACGMD